MDKLTYADNFESLVDVSGHKRCAFKYVDICDDTSLKHVFDASQRSSCI